MGWLPAWLGGAPPAAAKKKKICCACPETKGPRDACVTEHGAGRGGGELPPPPPPPPPGREPLPPLAPAPAGPEPRVTARIEPPRRALLGRRRGGVPRGHGVRTRGEAREVLTRSRAGGVRAGPEARECQELIEKHKECLRAEGFNV